MGANVINYGVKGGEVTIRFDSTGGTVNFGDINVAGETVVSAKLSHLLWTANADQEWTYTRGSNTVLTLNKNGNWNFTDNSLVAENSSEQAANTIVASLSGGSGSLVVRLKKTSSFNSDY